MELSLLHTYPLDSGLVAKCQKLDVKILAYSPLGQGRLCDKYYDDEKKWRDMRGSRYFAQGCSYQQAAPLLRVLRELADFHKCKMAQIAVAWIVAKGCIPVCGCKSEPQLAENAASLLIKLTPEEVRRLDAVSLKGSVNYWQGRSS